MADAARTSGKLLMVGMVRRFGETTRALKQYIADGRLGRLYYARAGYVRRWGNPGGWFASRDKSGGGPVIDLGVHVIDLVRYLAGGPRALSVSASVFSRLGAQPGVRGVDKYRSVDSSEANDVEDGAVALIRFAEGLTLAVEVSWVQHTKAEKTYLEVCGERGGAQLDPELEIHSRSGDYLIDTRPLIEPAYSATAISFGAQAAHFVDCVRNGAPCLSPAEDGVELMRIIDAIYESARLGREVRLDEAR
jgi:predicted dehydrogenase